MFTPNLSAVESANSTLSYSRSLHRRLTRQVDHRFSDTDNESYPVRRDSHSRTVSMADLDHDSLTAYWDHVANSDTQWVEANIRHYHADDSALDSLLNRLAKGHLRQATHDDLKELHWIAVHQHVVFTCPDEEALARLTALSVQPEPFW
jgi:hypothetical protein